MMNSSTEYLILGAGPAGMAAAMELSNAGKKSLLIEKASAVGGLAKTIEIEHAGQLYRTDIGPHRFFSKNKYLYDFIEDLLHEDWIQVPRLTRFYVDGHFYFYPIQMGDVLRNIGFVRAVRVLTDYLYERVRKVLFPRTINSFEQYVLAQFGRTLADFNMINYTEKIWGIPASTISVDWAEQRIGGLSFWSVLKKALFKTSGPKSLVDTFYYPSKGSGLIYEAIKKRIEEKGSVVQLNVEPVAIRWSGNKVTEVDVQSSSGVQTVAPKVVINSVPLTRTIELLDPPPPPEVLEATKKLRFRAQVYLFLTVDKDSITKDNWVYFPNKEIPFGRISEMKNFSTDMSPEGKTSLFIEFFCFEGDSIWNASKEELFHMAISWLSKLDFLHKEDVSSVHHYKQKHVYPLYDLEYSNNVQTIMNFIDQFENFYAIGRPGRFRYTNQDHSLEMGILAAQSALDGHRRNVDEVGAEKEYFERGYVPKKV